MQKGLGQVERSREGKKNRGRQKELGKVERTGECRKVWEKYKGHGRVERAGKGRKDDVRYLLKGFFPSGNFPRVFSQAATSQMCNFPSRSQIQRSAPQPIQTAALVPHCSLRRLRGPNLTCGKLSLGKLYIWEVATWEIVTWKST